jgi:hypothetical protein
MTSDDHTRPGDTVGNDKVGSDKTGRDKVGRDKTTIYNYHYYNAAGTPPATDPPPLAVPDRWLLAHPHIAKMLTFPKRRELMLADPAFLCIIHSR